jgi:predicted dehydrogenase
MSIKKTGVGFIGCGGFASGNHIPNVHKNPSMEIVSFCDINKEKLDELDRQYSPSYVTTDMERLFSDPEVEMVVCSTKPDFRLPIMQMAVKYNKPLFVEKPLCMTNEEVEIMVKLIKESGVPFMVGFNRPYSSIMQELRSIYRKAKKGSATIIYRIIGEAQLWPKHHYDAIMVDKETTILHETTHIFDLLDWITGEHPERVYVEGEGNTDNIITLSYPDNITAVIISGDNGSVGYPKERIEINTNYQTIVGDCFAELSHYSESGLVFNKQYPVSQGGGEEYTTKISGLIEKLFNWRKSVTPEEIKTGYYYDSFPKLDKGHYSELEYFRNCIESGTNPETGVEQGAIANIVAWAAYESWKSKSPVACNCNKVKSL